MKKRKFIIKAGIISVCAALGLFLVVFAGYSAIYAKRNYANQYIGSSNFGGKNKAKTKEILQEKTKDFLSSDLELTYQDKDGQEKSYNIKPSDLGLQYNVDATAENLWHYGRNQNALLSFWQQLQSLFKQNKQQADYAVNEDSLNKKISEIALTVDNPEKDFRFYIRAEHLP